MALRPDSLLGVPGLMGAYRAGNVGISNAPGTGIADDKAVYVYLPALIRYFLGEEPILDQVRTHLLENEKDREHVLANLDTLVVKAVDGAGGYGILIGAACHPGGAPGLRPPDRAEPARLHRPGDGLPVAGPGVPGRPLPRPGTSTCARSSPTARSRTSCPAGSRAWRCRTGRSW